MFNARSKAVVFIPLCQRENNADTYSLLGYLVPTSIHQYIALCSLTWLTERGSC